MQTTVATKALILLSGALLAVIAGLAAAMVARADHATIPASLRAAAVAFGASLTLFLAVVTAYAVL